MPVSGNSNQQSSHSWRGRYPTVCNCKLALCYGSMVCDQWSRDDVKMARYSVCNALSCNTHVTSVDGPQDIYTCMTSSLLIHEFLYIALLCPSLWVVDDVIM